MAEATYYKDSGQVDITAPEALSNGQIELLPDGRAGYYPGLRAAASGDTGVGMVTEGRVTLAKTSGVVCIDGLEAYWDRSANTVTSVRAVAGGDFPIGTFHGDAASTDTTVVVNLNQKVKPTIDMHRDAGVTIPVLTAGTPFAGSRGGNYAMAFSATAEAQKLDWISVQSIPLTIGAIGVFEFYVDTAADADVADFFIGFANATHATDHDSITESVGFSNDSGADLNLDAESDDGTTEVAATDTTVDLVARTPVTCWIDARSWSDIKLYVNGSRVLSSTTFTLADATGPVKLLAHLEKTSNDTAGQFDVLQMYAVASDIA